MIVVVVTDDSDDERRPRRRMLVPWTEFGGRERGRIGCETQNSRSECRSKQNRDGVKLGLGGGVQISDGQRRRLSGEVF